MICDIRPAVPFSGFAATMRVGALHHMSQKATYGLAEDGVLLYRCGPSQHAPRPAHSQYDEARLPPQSDILLLR
jgi:hypothetical protein